MTNELLKQQVTDLFSQDPMLLPAVMAERLGATEYEIVEAFPHELVTIIDGAKAQEILEGLADWGLVTTIIHSFGSIFEVKAPFPKGTLARGYYNLMGKNDGFHGHLQLENVNKVALLSKPFMGLESYYFGFFNEQGDNIFKIYLGRDENRVLFSEQIIKFKALQKQYK